jgi:putative serine protease PepD
VIDEGRRRRFGPAAWLWIAIIALVGGVVGGVIGYAISPGSDNSTVACDATSVANEVVPSVVTIQIFNSSGGAAGTGSGEFFRSGGYILTNNHVIAGAVSGGRIDVILSDGSRKAASLVGRDALTDLAVLRAPESESSPVIPLGSSSSVDVGQPVVVVGAPLGLSSTVTTGIVSALGRTVEVPGESNSSPSALLVDALQTDAAINPGNSGGALVDCSGQLIGVPTAGAQIPGSGGGSIGLGFAIPIDLAQAVANEIIETGRATHSNFGLRAVPIGTSGQRAGAPMGLYVTAVQPGGPAAMAGLRAEDIITQIDGEPAQSVDQLVVLSITKRPGDTVKIEYLRDGKTTTTSITLGAQS